MLPLSRIGTLLVCTLVLLAGEARGQQVFYVDDNAAPGGNGSSLTPFQTIQAAANLADAGDTVIVRAGTYVGFNVVHSGAVGSPVTFSAESGVLINQAAATYNGTNHRSRINLDSVSHVVIEGFEVVGTNHLGNSQEGVRIVAPSGSSHGFITIRNNHIHHNGNRNILSGHVNNITVENNVVHHAYREHGIYLSNSSDNHIIRGNISYSNSNNGIHLNGDASQGDDGVMSNLLVENNHLYDNGAGGTYINPNGAPGTSAPGGSAINGDGVQNSRIQNNLIYNTHASGISLYRIDGADPSINNVVANNTVLVAADGRWALNIANGSFGNTAFNNILFSEHPFRGALTNNVAGLAQFISDYNLVEDRFSIDGGSSVMGLDAWQLATGQDLNSIVISLSDLENNLFVNFDGSNFELRSGSLAHNAGVDGLMNGTFRGAPLYDFLERLRPFGLGYDIGALELQPVPVPEPGTLALLGMVAVSAAGYRWRLRAGRTSRERC